ncbi:MAG: ATP-binding protein [Acidimicrobiaceae bacterium]|nr:ATP-binding protein [Acidimicrobiaceae bacterium]
MGLTDIVERNPFSPDFGESPPALVGRETLLSALFQGLASGPGNREFTTLLLGVRGSGKTVLLKHVRDAAEKDGWIALSVSGSSGNLGDQIVESIEAAKAKYESIEEAAEQDSRITAFRFAGVGLSWTRGDQPAKSVGRQLRELADSAQRNGTSVLLTVDELQGVDREQARELARDLQDIVKLDHLPLGFVGAGLPELQYTLLEDKKITFLQRCHRLRVPPLTVTDALSGLERPISEFGGDIDRGALRLAAESVGESPYRLQATGHACWNIAGTRRTIETWMVEEAINEADRLMIDNIHLPAWYSLSEQDQVYLGTVAALGGSAEAAEIARRTNLRARRLAESERRLELSQYVERVGNRVLLSGLVPAEVANKETQRVLDYALPDAAAPTPQALGARCGQFMPRAKAKCVLSRGHKGGHRSRL